MRKSFLLFLVLFLTAVCVCAAAETEFALEPVSGRISFNEDLYVVLTPGNLSEHPDLLADIGRTAEELQADWNERGVMLQAWSKDKKTSVEVSVTQDEDSAKYYDLETRTNAERRQYYKDQLAYFKSRGYIVEDSEIKLHSKSGHYVVIEYIRKDSETPRRGILRKIVRNGYTMCVDYEVYERKLTKTDRDRSRHIINTVVIDSVAPVPSGSSAVQAQSADTDVSSSSPSAAAAGTLNVTVLPPSETNDGIFTIEGKAYPGSKLIIVAMRWSGAVHRYYADATKAGNFKCKVTLPEEGLYQFTINMDINDQPVADAVLNAVTYSKTLLPVTMDAEIPEQLTSDQLVISGTTVKGVTIQCIVTNGLTTYDKTVRTSGKSAFRFVVDTSAEADYDITLAFSKKNLNSKRLTWKTTRRLSAQDVQERTEKNAKRVSYNALVKKLDSYIGETIVFDAYIVSVEHKADDWLITAATKLSRGTYSNFLYYTHTEDPGLAAGSKVKLYGICRGAYQELSEEGNEKYPDFDYLSFD